MNFKCVYVSDWQVSSLEQVGREGADLQDIDHLDFVWDSVSIGDGGCYLQGWASSSGKFTDKLLKCCNWVDVWLEDK